MKSEYFSLIRNPMTIIALFVGLTEIGFGLAFSRASGTLQSPFLYFMMGFPVLVCVGFFLVLFFRPHHFYSPGDYRSDESYLAASHGPLSQTLFKISETEHDKESVTPDPLRTMADNLDNPVCWYLLKVADKPMTIAEHTKVLIREWESAGKDSPPHPHKGWAFSAYLVAHTQTLNHLLLDTTFDEENDTLTLSLSPETLRLLMHKVRPETGDSL